jgi:hypothetical protein
VATAAPTISRDLSSAAGYTWIGAAYLLANAASGVIWAKLSDIWGRKMILLLALGAFFVSSAVCATAKSMEALIIGRAFQGTAGGGLILLVHVCISDLFSLRYDCALYEDMVTSTNCVSQSAKLIHGSYRGYLGFSRRGRPNPGRRFCFTCLMAVVLYVVYPIKSDLHQFANQDQSTSTFLLAVWHLL